MLKQMLKKMGFFLKNETKTHIYLCEYQIKSVLAQIPSAKQRPFWNISFPIANTY